MGRSDTPVRRAFNYATEKFLHDACLYVLTVVGVNEEGRQQTYGLFVEMTLRCSSGQPNFRWR